MDHSVEQFLSAGASDAHAVVYRWLSPRRVALNRRAEIEPLHARALRGPGGAEDGAGGARIVELAGELTGHAVIASEQERRLATSWGAPGDVVVERRRFAAVDARTFALETPGAMGALLAALRSAFPGCVEARVYRRSGGPADLESLAADAGLAPSGVIHNRRLLAGRVGAIQELAPPERFARVAAVRAHDLDFYGDYERHYNGMLAERPDLAPEIPIESREDMAVYLAEGLLHHILIDDRPAGVFAARWSVFAGMHGYQVWEKFLYPEFRGKGLAAAAQRRFVETLDPGDDAILFGFIHPRNVWSLRAAAHDGRVDVGGYAFLAL